MVLNYFLALPTNIQGGVCLAFADEVLCWLYGTVKESENSFTTLIRCIFTFLSQKYALVAIHNPE